MSNEHVMIDKLVKARKLPSLMGREEMLEMLLAHEYGYLPPKPDTVVYKVKPNVLPNRKNANFCSGNATIYQITATYGINGGTFSFVFYAAIPKSEKKLPFIVSINFCGDVPELYMPTEELMDNGFAILSFCYEHITKDNGDFTDGLSGILYKNGKRNLNDPGKIAMWAWAAQRVMDYAETLDCLDMERAAVCGHSRLGKTALLAAAIDERFKFCYANESGCSGAALSRENTGEKKSDICRKFPYWFSENYCASSHDPYDLPYDQHYLLASIAPRYVLVGSASEDLWADPLSQFLCTAAATPAFERAGVEGLVCEDEIPGDDATLLDGHIGYHCRPGKHYFSRTDWHRFMEFIRRHSL